MSATPKAPAALTIERDGDCVLLVIDGAGTLRIPPAESRKMAQRLLLLASEAELCAAIRP